MLVDVGQVSLQFYLYGSDASDEVGEYQDSTVTEYDTGTRRSAIQTLTETTSTVIQSLTMITMNMTQCVASTSREFVKQCGRGQQPKH
jgi:hypothetical protein